MFFSLISEKSFSFQNKQVKKEANILISNALEEKKIKTVVANGYGNTLESASQNAAENALTNVVGSFLDIQTILKEKTKINNGIISESTVIKENINDYSQGSIKYFEVLNVQEKDSIYIVTARVDVRIEDFKAYIKKLASDTKEIDSGLFTSIKTDQDNIENKIDLLGKILNPLINGEVIDIEIGNPQRLKELSAFNCKYLNIESRISCDNYKFYIGSSINPNSAIALPIIFSLNKDFQNNAINILENISSDKWSSNLSNSGQYTPYRLVKKDYDYNYLHNGEHYTITLLTIDNRNYTRYLIKDARIYNEERGVNNNLKKVPVDSWNRKCSTFYPYVRLSFIDEKETSLWSKDFLQCHTFTKTIYAEDKNFNIQFIYFPVSRGGLEPSYSTLYNTIRTYTQQGTGNIIFDKSRLLLLVEPKGEMMNKVKSIKLEYVQR